jgi:hypothetical protein
MLVELDLSDFHFDPNASFHIVPLRAAQYDGSRGSFHMLIRTNKGFLYIMKATQFASFEEVDPYDK